MGGYRLSFSPLALFQRDAEHCHMPGAMCRHMTAPRSSHVERALTWEFHPDSFLSFGPDPVSGIREGISPLTHPLRLSRLRSLGVFLGRPDSVGTIGHHEIEERD